MARGRNRRRSADSCFPYIIILKFIRFTLQNQDLTFLHVGQELGIRVVTGPESWISTLHQLTDAQRNTLAGRWERDVSSILRFESLYRYLMLFTVLWTWK
jgi:hypothetical protein